VAEWKLYNFNSIWNSIWLPWRPFFKSCCCSSSYTGQSDISIWNLQYSFRNCSFCRTV